MADGSSYEIDLIVKSVGAETSADQLNALAGRLDAAGAVATSFDSAIERTRALLADASAASASAASAVEAGAASYAQLERASTKAAQAVERAALAGKDTSELQANANAAAAACSAQATVLDELRATAASTAAAESKLAATMKSLEAAAKSEAAAMKTAASAQAAAAKASEVAAKNDYKLDELTKKAIGPLGEKAEKFQALTKIIGSTGWVGALVLAEAAVLALSAAVIVGVFALAKMAVEVNKQAMEKLAKTSEKAKKDFAELFAGVHVDKFASAMASVGEMLSQNTSTGRALKLMLSTLLNPLFDAIPVVLPVVKQFFAGMVLGALEVAIAFVKVYIAAKNMIPASWLSAMKSASGSIDWMRTALIAGEVVLGVIGVALAVLTGLLVVFALAVAVALWPLGVMIATFLICAAIILSPIIAIVLLIAYFDELLGWFGTLASGAASAGGAIIDGLVNSISSGAGMVFDALRNLGAGAMGALKSALGIASPSKFAAEYAANVTTTFSSETDDGAADVHASLAALAEPPDMPQRGAARGANAGASGGASSARGGLTFNNCTFSAGRDAAEAKATFEELLTGILSGDAQQLAGAT